MKLARGLSYSKWSDLGRLCPHEVMILLPCPETLGQRHQGSLRTPIAEMTLYPYRLQDSQWTDLGTPLQPLRQHQQGQVGTPQHQINQEDRNKALKIKLPSESQHIKVGRDPCVKLKPAKIKDLNRIGVF